MLETAPKTTTRTTSGAVATAGGETFYGVEVLADGTNACTVIVYDNATTNSGAILAMCSVSATGADRSFPPFKRQPLNGIYVQISAGTPTVVVTSS